MYPQGACRIRKASSTPTADLPPVPGVVAKRDDVRTRIQNVLRLLRGDADAGGVLTVNNTKIDAVQLLERAQVLFEAPKSARTRHITDCHYTKVHLFSLCIP